MSFRDPRARADVRASAFAPRVALPLFLAVTFLGCDKASTGEESLAGSEVRGHLDPMLGGSAEFGSASGLAILDAPPGDRPFFRDFGKIPRGESRDWVIRLYNQDPEPVAILDARGSCECIRVRRMRARAQDGAVTEGDMFAATPPLLVVPPGAVLEFDLELTTERVTPNTDKLAMFRVITDSEGSPYLTFEAHVIALDSFVATPAELAFGEVPQGYGGRTKVRILAEPRGSPAKILGIAEQGARVRGEFEETFYGGEFVWHLLADVPPLEPLGAIRDRIVLRTTDDLGQGDAGRMEVRVLATVVRDVRIDPPLLAFGAQRVDATAEVRGTLDALVPGARAKVTGHRFEGASAPFLTASFEPLAPDETGRATTTRVIVALRAGHPPGQVAARLHVELDDPQNPTTSVPVSGVVR